MPTSQQLMSEETAPRAHLPQTQAETR